MGHRRPSGGWLLWLARRWWRSVGRSRRTRPHSMVHSAMHAHAAALHVLHHGLKVRNHHVPHLGIELSVLLGRRVLNLVGIGLHVVNHRAHFLYAGLHFLHVLLPHGHVILLARTRCAGLCGRALGLAVQ